MSARTDRVPLAGSEAREELAPAPLERAPALDAPHQVTILLRPRGEAALAERVAEHAARLPRERRGADGLEEELAADPAAIAAAVAFAGAHDLTVVEASAERRTVVVAGTLGALCRAFAVECAWHRHGGGVHLAHQGPVHLPRALVRHTLAVLGLDRRPIARPGACGGHAGERHVAPPAVGRAYGFPRHLDGAGERLAIVLLGGGFHGADVDAFFSRQRLARPAIEVTGIGGANNEPAAPRAIRDALAAAGIGGRPLAALAHEPAGHGGDVHWTIEATLDVELAGALAPKAALEVVFAPATIEGKVHAFSRLLAPGGPPVVAASWGGFERLYREQDVRALESLFATAAAREVTLCFASGDSGDGSSAFGSPYDEPVAFYPAASPHVLACGGTTFDPQGGAARETVWTEELAGHPLASGGGVSRLLARPAWQKAARPPRGGRALPDVAAKADIRAGYAIVVGGEAAGMGGTSAAAPLWAALWTLVNQALRAGGGRPVGYVTPLLYRPELRAALRDVVAGTNGAYRARAGWDACTGWGSPDGAELLRALTP